jgi:hypothetical protein
MADQPERFEEAYTRFILRGMFWTFVVLMICIAFVICTSIYSADQRRAHTESAESEAKEAVAMAEYQKSVAMLKIKEVDELRAKLEKENRQQIGGDNSKAKKAKK